MPLGNLVIARTLAGSSFLVPAFAAIGIGGALVGLRYLRGQPLAAIAPCSGEAPESHPKRWPYLVILGVLTLVLVPSSFEAVAARIGLNIHPVSFLIGPALYSSGNGLLPGLDYYTQYSIGIPWLFHFVMGRSAEHAVLAYVVIVIVATWLFYAHLLFLLQWLYRSWIAAAIVAFIPLFLGFVYPSEFPAPYFAPSSSILRYPLLTICAMLTGYWADAPARPARLASIAAATGLSIFLETESGIVMMMAAPMTIFLVHPWRSYVIVPIITFVAVSLAVFAAMLFVAFGSATFQFEFIRRLFDGVILYGTSGFGGVARELDPWRVELALPFRRSRRIAGDDGGHRPDRQFAFLRQEAHGGVGIFGGLRSDVACQIREYVARRGLANERDRAAQRSGMVVRHAHLSYRSRHDRAGQLCRLAARRGPNRRLFAVGASALIRCEASSPRL